MGTPRFAVPTLDALAAAGHHVALVVTRQDKPRGRSGAVVPPPVKVRASELGLPVFQPAGVRGEEAGARVADVAPDVLVVVAYGRLLPVELLRVPRLGGINVHASLLPALRGAAPINWAIANGEPEAGVTTMQMDAGLDTGAMLLRARTPIGRRETAPRLAERLADLGAELLVRTLAGLAASTIVAEPQDESRATLAPILRKEDGIIDWSLSATRIDARIRGFDPWPGCTASLCGRGLRVDAAEPAPDVAAEAGEIVTCDGTGIVVACGAGTALRVTRVTPAGRRTMDAAAFANGARLRSGDRFDPTPTSSGSP